MFFKHYLPLSKTIILPMIFIMADVICVNSLGISFDKLPELPSIFFALFLMILQILFAPMQSALSDFYGRRKSLIFSLLFTMMSFCFLTFDLTEKYLAIIPMLVAASILKGCFGNTLPICLAVIADIETKNFRKIFAMASSSYAFAYLFITMILMFLERHTFNFVISIALIIIFSICFIFFKDKHDASSLEEKSENKHMQFSLLTIIRHEITKMKELLADGPTKKILMAFFFWEISLYCVLICQIDYACNKSCYIAEWMMIGYILGATLLFFLPKIKDTSMIYAGYALSSISLVPYFLSQSFTLNELTLLTSCYFVHSIGNAFLSPSLMSLLAKTKKPEERGKIYGLTESTDTLALLGATIFVIFIKYFHCHTFTLISFSFVSFLISFVFIKNFKMIRKI